ncbi:MAG TPA: GGDEF domain-containing protein [Ideonella sp.]|jgi:diguanylate cyclase (GGDEF)-like protein|nr:GGDEF domain-containing protein [Ideonella sp.]
MFMRWWRRLLMALLAITVLALAWNHWGMERRLVIDAASRWPVMAVDDRSADDGNSVSELRREGQRLVLDCVIGKRYQYPFCELQFALGQAPLGMDLSRYDSLRVWLTAQAGDKDIPVRLSMRNFNPRYSRVEDVGSLKVHEIAFTPAQYPGGLEFPLARIAVASWWVDEHPLPLEQSGHELNNVVTLAVTTAGMVPLGPNTISVERVELRGKWISAGTLGLGLVAMWVVAMLGSLVVDSVQARRRLRQSSALQASLRRLNAQLQSQSETLAQQVRHDALSGALNRHGLTDALIGQARQNEASLFPASLLFIDIDRFKDINDSCGHAVGDQVIRRMVEIVRGHVQRSDLLARWGGEEFLLLCQQTPEAEAVRVAERLRYELALAAWPQGLRVTCSFGVAEWRRGQELDDAIRLADEAMYRAKREGRDRVVCANGRLTDSATVGAPG